MSIQNLQANIATLNAMLVAGAVIYRRERGSDASWERRESLPDQPNFYRYEYKVEVPAAKTFNTDDVQTLVAIRSALNLAIEGDSIAELEVVNDRLQRFVSEFQSR